MKKTAYLILLFCVQALKAHLTHNSLSSRELVEKFLDRKIREQVRQRARKKWPSDCCQLMVCVSVFPDSMCTVERSTAQSPSSRLTGDQNTGSELRC